MASGVVGAAGGTVAAPNGEISVDIPAGALAADITVSITLISAPVTGAIGPTYDLQPTGTTFAQPVTLTFAYSAATLGTHAAGNLAVATVVGSNQFWTQAGASVVDTTAQTVSATTTHFSPWALVDACSIISCGPGSCCVAGACPICGQTCSGPPDCFSGLCCVSNHCGSCN